MSKTVIAILDYLIIVIHLKRKSALQANKVIKYSYVRKISKLWQDRQLIVSSSHTVLHIMQKTSWTWHFSAIGTFWKPKCKSVKTKLNQINSCLFMWHPREKKFRDPLILTVHVGYGQRRNAARRWTKRRCEDFGLQTADSWAMLSFTPSFGWLTGRPPIAAPWHSVVVALTRGKGGTGGRGGGDSAKPLESRQMARWTVSSLDWLLDGWMIDRWGKRGMHRGWCRWRNY